MDQRRLFPDIQDLRKRCTIWCSEVFDELNSVINYIEAGKHHLNPIQRLLLERFILGAVEFAHDLLLAEGDKEEIERRLAVSGHNQRLLYVDAIKSDRPYEEQRSSTGGPVALHLYEDAPAGLRKIQANTLDGINDGILAIIRDIADEQTLPDSLEREALDELAAVVNDLHGDIALVFRARFGIIETLKVQYATKINSPSTATSEVSDGTVAQLTVDDFMCRVAPPRKPPKVTDCLAPFVHDIARLRANGYTWDQVCEFLQQNGIALQASSVGAYFRQWSRQE